MGGGVGENYLPRESSRVLSKSSKVAWAPPITLIVQATSLWARLWFFPLPPSGIPTPLPGNYGKVPYTPFATREMYPLDLPTQRILGIKISVIVRVSLLILHPDPFIQNHTTYFVAPSYTPLLWKPGHPFIRSLKRYPFRVHPHICYHREYPLSLHLKTPASFENWFTNQIIINT